MASVRRLRRMVAMGLILAGVLLADSSCALASDLPLDISQYAHTAWKVRDGFAQGPIVSIAQTPDGYLWLGTEFGLLRFDGVRAVPFQAPAGGQLPGSYVDSLLVSRDGTLWIGTRKGLASWKNDKLTQYPEFVGQAVGEFLEDRDGTIWFGTYDPGRLCAVQGGKPQCYGAGSFGVAVIGLYEDRNGDLWFSTTTGLWRWKPGRPERYPFPLSVIEVDSLAEDDNGTLLLATNDGLEQLAGGKIRSYPLPRGTPQFRPNRFFRDRDGSLWIGAMQGLFRLDHGRLDTFGTVDGLSGDFVLRIFKDREGNIWTGTVDGLDRFREYAVPRLSRNQGLSTSAATSVQATADGAIWVGTTNGLNRWDASHVTVYGRRTAAAASGLGDQPALSLTEAVTNVSNSGFAGTIGYLAEDDRGRLWVSTNDGLLYLERGLFIRVPGVAGGDVYGIGPDGHGNMWISNNTAGLLQVTPGDAVRSTPWSRLGHTGFGARALLADRVQGGVWLGFNEGGLIYVKDGQVRASYTSADGLGSGRVIQLRFGSLGGLWAATEGGLSRLKDGHIATLTSKNGLPCDEVHWSMEDDDHFLWVDMPCGLVRIAPSEWKAWIGDSKRTVQTMIFDNSDGVRNIAEYGGYGPHVTKSPDGKIWFTDQDGVGVIDPHRLPRNEMPPPVHIEQITADGKPYDASSFETGSLRLPPLVRDLTIDYTAMSLIAPEKMHFRFKLEGQDRDWREVVNDREVQYSNLRPGNYRFRVTASNNSGVWNEAGTSLDFSVAPAYYQTAWFGALCAAAFLALLWGLYQYRLHQIRMQFNVGLEERVGERTRIARELHDTLLQSFHGLMFQFQAARNMLPQRPEEAMNTLDGAISATEQAIAEGRSAIHDLRPQSASQGDLAQLLRSAGEELARLHEGNRESPNCSVIVEGEPRTLLPMLQDEVYRIGREVLRNAFRHACAYNIEVEIRYSAQGLRLRIRDDGAGIDPKVLDRSERSGHWGLPGMRERAERIGAKLGFWSEAGAGTEVELTVPAAVAYRKAPEDGRFKLLRKARRYGELS